MTDALTQNVGAEKALLGALLVNGDLIDHVRWLEPTHFYDPAHAALFETIATMVAEGRKVTPPLVMGELPAEWPDGEPEQRQQYLAHLAANATTLVNVPDYARAVRQAWLRRGLLSVADELAHDVIHAAGDAAKMVDKAEQQLGELRVHAQVRRSPAMTDALDDTMAQLSAAMAGKQQVGMTWCLPEIERVTDSVIEPGDLVGMLGASGDGKSSLALQMARHTADAGKPVLFLSGEQSVQQCIRQLCAQRLGISAKAIRRGRGHMSEEEFEQVAAEAAVMRQLPLAVETWSDATVAKLTAQVRSFTRAYGPGLVILDHAKKVLPDDKRAMFAQQVFAVMDGLKVMARDTGNAVLVLMQRNSDFLRRQVMRPVRADSYGGEGPLQPLDTGFAIFRPSRWKREAAKIEPNPETRADMLAAAETMDIKAGPVGRSLVELYCLKSRFGDDQMPHQEVAFENEFTRFHVIDRPIGRDAPASQDELVF